MITTNFTLCTNLLGSNVIHLDKGMIFILSGFDVPITKLRTGKNANEEWCYLDKPMSPL